MASLEVVLGHHMTEAIGLQHSRRRVVKAAQTTLFDLGALDDRLESHLDGLLVAGPPADEHGSTPLAADSTEVAFVGVVTALKRGDFASGRAISRTVGESEYASDALVRAFGWVASHRLRHVVRDLLTDADSIGRVAGLTACAMHRVDPGFAKGPWLRDPDAAVRARALRTTGEIGYREAMNACLGALSEPDVNVRFWAAWSAVLLGDRNRALRVLVSDGTTDSPHRPRAFRLALQTLPTADAHGILKNLARDPKDLRWLIQGSGIVGDPAYVPWLINHMSNPALARLAAESFTLITGVDLDAQQMWAPRPEGFESGPTEDPADENVGMDPDEGLPWPDVKKVEQWWAANGSRFQQGQRDFLGQPVSRAHCVDVLRNGYQRQRMLAAHYLCLLEPGTPLFNTSAPAWRQQRLLAKMG